jgi:hypothetical protein
VVREERDGDATRRRRRRRRLRGAVDAGADQEGEAPQHRRASRATRLSGQRRPRAGAGGRVGRIGGST